MCAHTNIYLQLRSFVFLYFTFLHHREVYLEFSLSFLGARLELLNLALKIMQFGR